MTTLALQGIPPTIQELMQSRTLERRFHDSLFPGLLFRAEARPELWQANLGEQQIFTRAGLIPAVVTPLTPGTDPTPKSYLTEQWEAFARQYGDTLDTHMPTSHVALASLFLRNTQQLGLQAGMSMNRLARNPMFTAYLAGETMVDVASGGAGLTLHVSSINGFTEQTLNGRLTPISAANPLAVTFSSAEPANTVVGAVPDDPIGAPLGPGTLSFGVATSGAVAARVAIFAANRSVRVRAGGGATVDALVGTNILTVNDVLNAVALLRENNVPTHPDGRYHVHISPIGVAQLFQDNHWQRLHQGIPEGVAYRDFIIGDQFGCYFYQNNELPNQGSVGTQLAAPTGSAVVAPEIGSEIVNNGGLPIRRAIVTGGGAQYEKYLDESQYMTEAGSTGKIGGFSIVNGGVAVMTNRIRFILRAPLDRLQQVVSQTWSWSGDFPVPSDALAPGVSGARYRRAIVIEHA